MGFPSASRKRLSDSFRPIRVLGVGARWGMPVVDAICERGRRAPSWRGPVRPCPWGRRPRLSSMLFAKQIVERRLGAGQFAGVLGDVGPRLSSMLFAKQIV